MNHKSYTNDNFQKALLVKSLSKVFGVLDADTLAAIESQLVWCSIAGNELLFEQNSQEDSIYFVITGRLQVFVKDNMGQAKKLGEIGRGETVGEMAVFTGEPRSASVIASRDSVLVKLSGVAFKEILSKYPTLSLNVTKIIVNRLNKIQSHTKHILKPTNICLLNIHPQHEIQDFISKFQTALSAKGKVAMVSNPIVAQKYPNLTEDENHHNLLLEWLDELESANDYVLYIADTTDTVWTQRCLRQSDEIVLIADAQQSPDLTDMDKMVQILNIAHFRMLGMQQTLWLIHAADCLIPSHTAKWLALRPNVQAHYHIRHNHQQDLNRLARIVSGTAIGFVLAGGGAKGFAHLGVIKALKEYNIPIDYIGGTSVGALLASIISFDSSSEDLINYAREGALFNPTKDINFLPFLSLVQGKRIAQMIASCIKRFVHTDEICMEDTWLTFFCVVSNFTQSKEEVKTRGNIVKNLRASSAIPGVFPPVIDGDNLLVDGGAFNNFPIDIMAKMGINKIIGSEFVIEKTYKLEITETPSPFELLKDKFRPKKKKKYRLPNIISLLLNSTILSSTAKRNDNKQMIDLYFNPDVAKFSIMDWQSYDKIVEKGYQHAVEVLSKMSESELSYFK